MSAVWDVAIAGGGATGLILGLALRALSGGALRIVLIDRSSPAIRSGPRTSALAEGPRRMLDRLGVWGSLADVAEPIRRMEISDAKLTDAVKAALLSFDAEGEVDPLAHMLFHRDLEPRLLEAATRNGLEVLTDAIDQISFSEAVASVRTKGDLELRARLLVGADGLNSRTRMAARIPVVSWPYERTALVLTIRHELEHNGLAVQHFLEGGPFACLPLRGRRSSIVWTESSVAAANCRMASHRALTNELEARLGHRFGSVEVEEGPETFPLIFQMARRFIAPRLALVGDAAHRVHPLAGQGLNIGLRDVATLAELILDYARLGLDLGSETLLREYERRRLFDATASAAAFDLIHKSYAVDGTFAPIARRVGMSAVERLNGLKRSLRLEASGLLGERLSLFR